jgi:adenine-specific DNA-methyltransferase
MTPPEVARFMAQRSLHGSFGRTVRVLDPAAGTGVLAAAALDSLLEREDRPQRVEIDLHELDQRLIPILRRLADHMRRRAKQHGVSASITIRQGDFLLSSVALARQPCADLIIANPPYFKIGGHDARAVAHAYAVHGQPNIYGLFMAVCAQLLNPAGRWCFITPRSWTNGAYFAAVRRHVCRFLHIDAMHLFESRRDHFTDDQILQEAMITWATAQADTQREVIVSSSAGSRDLAAAQLMRHPANRVIGQDAARTIVLPDATREKPWEDWTATLATYGLKVSTGPVVAFRAIKHLRENASRHSVPLLWMQHIAHMQVHWPIGKKREHITASAASAWMLLPNTNLVVMRRFSPKEDQRRITAAPYLAGVLPGAVIGLENHTNYIFRPGGTLSTEETRGLAALLNSRVIDAYLRSVAGNTQVNATDLRKLPLPPLEQIVAIGRALRADATLADADAAVAAALDRPLLALAG